MLNKVYLGILFIVFILSGAGFVSGKLKMNGISKSIKGEEAILLDLWLDEVPSTNGKLFKEGEYTDLMVRNRPHGKLQIESANCVPLSTDRYFVRRVSIPTEQASKAPFDEPFLWQCRLTIKDNKALSTTNGYVSQGNPLKIGMRISLEDKFYRVDGYIVNINSSKNN